MDLDIETDVMLGAAEAFEMAFADARNAGEIKAHLEHAMSEVRARHPGVSETTLWFAAGVAFGRRHPLSDFITPDEAPNS